MKVLFVASGNSKNFEMSPFIKAQGETLINEGIEVEFFSVVGKGLTGYLRSARKLNAFLKGRKYDIIHAHYMLCGWVAVLSRPKTPIVLSLMGDDAYGTYYKPYRVSLKSRYLTLLTLLIQPFLKGIIAKSRNILKYVYRKKITSIIPNGVRLEQFKDYNKGFREELCLDPHKKYILFLADTSDPNKNFALLKQAHELLCDENIGLITPYPKPHDQIVKYLWSADVFVLPSFAEGSANVLKEAMACNCPLVATNAGDAWWVIGDTPGCFAAGYTPEDFSEKLKMALSFAEVNKRTKGRQRLIDLGLDASLVARKVIAVYNKTLKIKQ